MSEQFRLTVRQLFTSRLLFVAQAQATFHGGKRYSLILVDVATIEAAAAAAKNRRSIAASTRRTTNDNDDDSGSERRRKPTTVATDLVVFIEKSRVGRQVSFPALVD